MSGHKPLFYGWWIIGALFVIQSYVAGVIVYGLTTFIDPIINEFGWNYAQVSLASSIRGMEIGILAPIVGLLIERWGPRRLIVTGAILFGIGLLFWSYTASLMQFYGFFFIIATGMNSLIGTLPTTVACYWFRKKASLVTGILMAGSAFGGFIVPLITRMIELLQWRTTIRILGLGACIIILPLAFVVRHKPAQYGLFPDGEQDIRRIVNDSIINNKVHTKITHVLKTRTFWQISIGITCLLMVTNAMTIHIMPYLNTMGVSRTESALIASTIPVASIIGRLGFGSLGDRFDKRSLASIGVALPGLALILCNFTSDSVNLFPLFFSIFGLGYGGAITLHATLIRDYFGNTNLGTNLGFSIGIVGIGNILGPPFAGMVFDLFGSYQVAWYAFIIICLIGVICLMTLHKVNINKTI